MLEQIDGSAYHIQLNYATCRQYYPIGSASQNHKIDGHIVIEDDLEMPQVNLNVG